VALLSALISAPRAAGEQLRLAHAQEPTADRWMYANNFSGGGRPSASTFSALPMVTGDDDRLAQVIVKFDTVAAGIPAGLGAANYQPTRVILTTIADSLALYYDPTEDPRSTYGIDDDTDTGRPFEIYGTGFRNGFTAASFQESSPFGGGSPIKRNAYALGYDPTGVPRDVTNNVTEGFDSVPWAIGKVTFVPDGETTAVTLEAGASVPVYASVTFELNLALPGVADYVRQAFHQGFLWLTLSSLHSSEMLGSSGFPGYYNKENNEHLLDGNLAPRLDAEYTLPLRVAAFSHDRVTDVCRIEWNASPGFAYVVQRSTTLLSDQWSVLTPTPLTTAVPAQLSFDGAGTGDRSFFRIVRTP
jgi:hypothetical protein